MVLYKIDVKQWEAGTPARAYAEFASAWQRREWKAAYQFVQITWASSNGVVELANRLSPFRLDKLVLIKRLSVAGLLRDVVADLAVLVDVKIGNRALKGLTYFPRLIKETAAFTASEDGAWGVNPASMFRVVSPKTQNSGG